jgi:hypothetical protein
MVTYQFEVDSDTWRKWKDTVPRSKNLDDRLRELVVLDAEGRIDGSQHVAAGAAAPAETEAETETSTARSDDTADTRPAVDRAQLREALAGSGDVLEARVNAIVAMYDQLRQEGEATKGELLGVVDAEAVNYAGSDSVWSNMVKGKKTLRALPGVEPPPTGRSTWRYSSE